MRGFYAFAGCRRSRVLRCARCLLAKNFVSGSQNDARTLENRPRIPLRAARCSDKAQKRALTVPAKALRNFIRRLKPSQTRVWTWKVRSESAPAESVGAQKAQSRDFRIFEWITLQNDPSTHPHHPQAPTPSAHSDTCMQEEYPGSSSFDQVPTSTYVDVRRRTSNSISRVISLSLRNAVTLQKSRTLHYIQA